MDGGGRGLTVSCWSLESALSFMPAAGGGAQDAGAGMAQLHPTAAGSLADAREQQREAVFRKMNVAEIY